VRILEVCFGALHLTVSSTRYCMGVVDLDASYVEKTLRRGAERLLTNLVSAGGAA